MRILHILNHARLGNGIVNVAVDLACAQAELGHSVAIASLPDNSAPILQRYGVQHFPCDQTRSPINLVKALARFLEIVQEFKPDIVHAHMMTGIVLAKLVQLRHSYALVSTVHNVYQSSSILMGLADRVIAVSQSVADLMQQRGVPTHKLRVVLNGTIGSPRIGAVSQPQALHHPAITTVAGMFVRKGVNYLIEGFAAVAPQFPEAHLYLVGTGDALEQFQALADQFECRDRIHFEGHQPAPQGYLMATDIFVLASLRESCPLVLSEAREAGCAIISTNVDGNPEALDKGQAGILVPSQSSDAIAEALTTLLSDAETLQTWRTKATQNLDYLNVARVNQDTLAVYQEFQTELRASAL
jgi:glycosyltransferase involved in cell wall biosynthesis